MADPIDTDATRAWLALYWPKGKGNHLTITLRDYCDEVDHLRAVRDAARRLDYALGGDEAEILAARDAFREADRG